MHHKILILVSQLCCMTSSSINLQVHATETVQNEKYKKKPQGCTREQPEFPDFEKKKKKKKNVTLLEFWADQYTILSTKEEEKETLESSWNLLQATMH